METSSYDLDILEFSAVRELLFERLTTQLGRTAVASLRPLKDAAAATQAMQEAVEVAARMAVGDAPPMAGLTDVRSWLHGFFAGERLPEAREIADLKRLLRAARRCREWLSREEGDSALMAFSAPFPEVSDLVEELDLVLDDRGEILTTASAKLAVIRHAIDAADAAVRSAVARFLSEERIRRYLQSPEPAWRHGRPVFQVRQEHRHHVPGVLHDRSQSGATLFIEPSMIVESANRLSDAKAAEHREILVVLAHICRGLRRCQAEIMAALQGLVALDLTTARARLITVDGFVPVPVVEDGPLRLRGALHPILLRGGLLRDQLVPLDVALHEPYALLVITGPNTGGKTVVLKTIGLLSLMAMAGVPLPAMPGTQIPFFDGLYADIGDDQGISQNLSTFSSHVTRITRCLHHAGRRSLVLLDELGTGTDPEEGGALGYAVLEELAAKGAAAVVSTHLGQLKEFAYTHPRAENGCMTFDGATLAPLYRLEVGIPGASHALDIAQRVGMPAPIVDRARVRIGKRDRSVEQVVLAVQAARREAESERQRALEKALELKSSEQSLEGRLQELERRNAWLEEEAGVLVEDELRTLRDQLEPLLRQLKNAPRPHGELAEKAMQAVQAMIRGASLHRRRMQFIGTLSKDSLVYVPRFGKRFSIRKIDRVREILTVTAGKLQIEIPFEDVSWLQPLDAPGA